MYMNYIITTMVKINDRFATVMPMFPAFIFMCTVENYRVS